MSQNHSFDRATQPQDGTSGQPLVSFFRSTRAATLNQAENTVESEADSKEEGAEHEVDLEHAVGRLRVQQTARLLLVVTLLGHVVVQGGVVEEAVRGLEGSDQASTRGGRTEAGVWHRAWITISSQILFLLSHPC